MAAEALAGAGHPVLVAEAMPSAGRKFLMAGKSGLNLTRDLDAAAFAAGYHQGADWLAPMIAEFGPEAVRDWAESLGVACFTGSSGLVFPKGMKASPLLRAWLRRLAGQGVRLHTRWRWTGWDASGAVVFETPEGRKAIAAGATVLALGGGSWARLGADGAWVEMLAADGVPLAPLRASNVGFLRDWSPAMARHFGAAVKPVRLTAGGRSVRGEFVISTRGVEGGGIYALGDLLREGAGLELDLMPDRELGAVEALLARPRGKLSLANHLRRVPGLSPVKVALLRELAPASIGNSVAMAVHLKALSLPLIGPRPIDEAISTAGGVMRAGLDEGLMLRARPGVFVAGEMLDWDAPTGGYLLTACFATGRHAGRAAGAWLTAESRG